MDLKGCRQSYYDNTGKASAVVQSISFAGIAAVWIFRIGDTGITIPRALVLPLVFFVATLACHLLQYLAGATMWGVFCRSKEKKMGPDALNGTNIVAPRWINWPAILFFMLKVSLVVAGYATLLRYVVRALSS